MQPNSTDIAHAGGDKPAPAHLMQTVTTPAALWRAANGVYLDDHSYR